MDEQEAIEIARTWLEGLSKEAGESWTVYDQGDYVLVFNTSTKILRVDKAIRQVVGMEIV